MLADDLAELEKVIAGQLDRFLDSRTIDRLLNYHPGRSYYTARLEQLVLQIPGNAQVRADWKGNKNQPTQDGIVLRDGSVVTASITVREIPSNWKACNLSPLKSVITLWNRSTAPWAYISEYSYSFYPNNGSARARALGYFRYDFHPEMLGDGDLGGHPYFHLHREFVDDDDETEEEFRLATGLVQLSEVLSICERSLFPQEREERLVDYLANGRFDDLALDLSPRGFDHLISEHYNARQWQIFQHRTRCENFLKKRGWKLPALEGFETQQKKKKRR